MCLNIYFYFSSFYFVKWYIQHIETFEQLYFFRALVRIVRHFEQKFPPQYCKEQRLGMDQKDPDRWRKFLSRFYYIHWYLFYFPLISISFLFLPVEKKYTIWYIYFIIHNFITFYILLLYNIYIIIQLDTCRRLLKSVCSFDSSYRIQLTSIFISKCHLQSSGSTLFFRDFVGPRRSEDSLFYVFFSFNMNFIRPTFFTFLSSHFL